MPWPFKSKKSLKSDNNQEKQRDPIWAALDERFRHPLTDEELQKKKPKSEDAMLSSYQGSDHNRRGAERGQGKKITWEEFDEQMRDPPVREWLNGSTDACVDIAAATQRAEEGKGREKREQELDAIERWHAERRGWKDEEEWRKLIWDSGM